MPPGHSNRRWPQASASAGRSAGQAGLGKARHADPELAETAGTRISHERFFVTKLRVLPCIWGDGETLGTNSNSR